MSSKSNLSNDKFRNTLNELRCDQSLCDVVLVTESNVEFQAHKIILSASSPHFRRMFTSETGCTETEIERISIENVDPLAFSELINYAYTGEIDVTADNAQMIFIASQLLQFNELFELCIKMIGANIKVENCLNIYELSTKYNLVDLNKKTINFICENFSNVIKMEMFSTLSPIQLQKLLSRTKSIINQEELIFDGIRKWIIQKNVKKETGFLFRFVNFSKLPNKYLTDLIDGISNDPIETELIEFLSPIVKKRITLVKPLFVFAYREGLQDNMVLYTFDIKQQVWHKKIPLRSDQKNSKLVILGNKLYILSETKHLDAYDLETNSWSIKAPLINEIAGVLELIVSNNKIYAFDDKTCAMYEPKINKWTNVLLSKNDYSTYSKFSVASYCNDIFIIGGSSLGYFTNIIRIFNLITKQWCKINMETARHWSANIVINGCLYILGGRNDNNKTINSMEIYDILKDEWKGNVMRMPIERERQLVAVYENEIFVFGGFGSNLKPIEQIDVYNTVTSQWRTLDKKCLENNRYTSVAVFNSDITKMTPFL